MDQARRPVFGRRTFDDRDSRKFEFLGYLAALLVVGLIIFLFLKPPRLAKSPVVEGLILKTRRTDAAERSRAIWELHLLKAVEVAAAVGDLIPLLSDESLADPGIAALYLEVLESLAGPFGGARQAGDVVVGDLAAFVLRRIRADLVIDCSGDGGPVRELRYVRRQFNKSLLHGLCRYKGSVKLRVLSVLLGDTDPAPIPAVIRCGLEDSDNRVREYAAALFLVYARTSPGKAEAAVPSLLKMVSESDPGLKVVAARALKAISGIDAGEDAVLWKDWYNRRRNGQ